MFFIDTNIFLEYLLQRQKWEQCEILFKKIESGEITAITSGFCVHTIELFMLAQKKRPELKEFLTYLISLEKLFVYHTLLVDEIRIISEMEKNNLEFEDALQYFVAKQFKCKAIISFDRHFDGLQIPRKTPAELA